MQIDELYKVTRPVYTTYKNQLPSYYSIDSSSIQISNRFRVVSNPVKSVEEFVRFDDEMKKVFDIHGAKVKLKFNKMIICKLGNQQIDNCVAHNDPTSIATLLMILPTSHEGGTDLIITPDGHWHFL